MSLRQMALTVKHNRLLMLDLLLRAALSNDLSDYARVRAATMYLQHTASYLPRRRRFTQVTNATNARRKNP